MARRRKGTPPSYCLHKQSGQAVFNWPLGSGRYRSILLGKHGTPESHAEYERVLAEWRASSGAAIPSLRRNGSGPPDLTLYEIANAFDKYARQRYRHPNGEETGEARNFKDALTPLLDLYGHTVWREFGPNALRAVQTKMVMDGLARKTVNARINRIRRFFKWTVPLEFHLSGALAFFKFSPVHLDQLAQLVRGAGDVQSREHHREPTVGGSQKDRPLFPLTRILVKLSQVRPAPLAVAQLGLAFVTEGIAQAPRLFALDALDLNVGHLPRRPQFVEPQFVAALGFASVNELDPRKVVEVAALAGRKEAGWDSRGRLPLLIADAVDVAAVVVLSPLKSTPVVRCSMTARIIS